MGSFYNLVRVDSNFQLELESSLYLQIETMFCGQNVATIDDYAPTPMFAVIMEVDHEWEFAPLGRTATMDAIMLVDLLPAR